MNFDELHESIPYAIGSKHYFLEGRVYPGVHISMPGRHQDDTPKKGGDFVVKVSCKSIGWNRHSFTHQDIFNDIEKKYIAEPTAADRLMDDYARVVFGEDPLSIPWGTVDEWAGSLEPRIFLCAAQCLAVAEHRRYARFESKGGGRFLPARMSSGIVEGLWTAEDANQWQRKGRPGLDALIKFHGAPKTLAERAGVEAGVDK